VSHLPSRQVPGIYHTRIGDALLTTLSDGYLAPPREDVQGLPSEAIDAALRAAFLPSDLVITVNAFLLRANGMIYLIDAGSSTSLLGPSVGRLLEALKLSGVSPEQVNAILATHLHPDHIGGLVQNGEMTFPNATLFVHERDVDHLLNLDTGKLPEGHESVFIELRSRFERYRDRVQSFSGGEVVPGVMAEWLPGHTPGHTGYRIRSRNEEVLIWGDIVHLPAIQVPHPEATLVYDRDPSMAVKSRMRALDMAAPDRLAVAGMHIDFPGFAYVERSGSGYRWTRKGWDPRL
jgi:glyoxylase-like metal-dependent hydrolase (beta-lactamase superfamily II)